MTDLQAQQRAERLVRQIAAEVAQYNEFHSDTIATLITAELLAVQRLAYKEALTDVAQDWASYEFRSEEQVSSLEVQTFLDTRHVHYPKAQAIRGESHE